MMDRRRCEWKFIPEGMLKDDALRWRRGRSFFIYALTMYTLPKVRHLLLSHAANQFLSAYFSKTLEARHVDIVSE